jgi:succinate-semialdehyde dehydrogenase/glutarate-semialdehyde dehydrogenase
MSIQAIDPTTGETCKTYDEMTPAEVACVIERVHNAFLDWRGTRFAKRARRMKNAAQHLREHVDSYAVLMAQEMGKPFRDGRAEVEKCAWVCDYYADHAERFLQPEIIETGARKSFVTFQPLGVVLAIMPWNFPFWQVFRFAAPALMAGNAAVLKHASNVPGCALAIEDLFRKAGFPDDLFRTLLIGSDQVDAVLDHALIKAATLTGSTRAGQEVAQKAGGQAQKNRVGTRRQ